MNNKFKFSFFIALLFSVLGAILKVNKIAGSYFFLLVAMIATLAYMITGIIEISKSTTIQPSKKIMWVAGLVGFSFFTGLLYLISFRKNKQK